MTPAAFLWHFARTVVLVVTTGVALLVGLGAVAAIAPERLLIELDSICGILLLIGLYRLYKVAEVYATGFPPSSHLTPAARQWIGRTLGMIWIGLIADLSVHLVRWMRGTAEYLAEHQFGRFSPPDLTNGLLTISVLTAVALAFAAEWHRTDGDSLRWPRYPNYLPDPAIYTPTGLHLRRLAGRALHVLFVLSCILVGYQIVQRFL